MKQTLFLREELASAWQGKDVFALLATQQGEIFRDKEGRRTLRFQLNGRSYFLKYHHGVGWAEIVKNLVQGRLPVISARNEWRAIKKLQQHGIDTMQLAAFGERGWNPARRTSFIVTDDLTDTMSLEDLGKQWQQPPSFKTKQYLIQHIARISKIMHESGLNHRDYYLCHFLLDNSFARTNLIDEDTRLFVIDLHRAQIRKKVPQRWKVKDLGALLFSAHEVPLTQRDYYRFMQAYSGLDLRDLLLTQGVFWHKVAQRAKALLAKWQR
ncbi:lipopolysaccharide core heptose(I) kinase RfaP [Methylophaga sp. OBS4]|uniref:lipopolysaccharide core heptose(I) kinase RfaP n=1 Tax=Methylophaga sp. OBS4 TaxID=2991935 RepID=UPI00225833B3|nr:lipopolysaccharide core heptose(I) kinase RfaP [Methylophaga sp. OBS4]MCX4187621.1 lipopolysaccharide core heptose(I) kinase RfaP [Methylophaga sp. OBS4]